MIGDEASISGERPSTFRFSAIVLALTAGLGVSCKGQVEDNGDAGTGATDGFVADGPSDPEDAMDGPTHAGRMDGNVRRRDVDLSDARSTDPSPNIPEPPPLGEVPGPALGE